jgi:hypothetical protein
VRIEELERNLPNGFHDALLRSFMADPVRQTIEFAIDVSIDDGDGYRAARLVLSGVTHLVVDPPGSGASAWSSRASMIDLCEADPALSEHVTTPPGRFSARFFVSDWNTFIHFAAADAVLTWTDGV